MGWVDHASPELDAESQWRTIVAICTVLSFFSILIVSLRLYIREKNHGLAADDWMAGLSMLFALMYSILCIVRMCYFSHSTTDITNIIHSTLTLTFLFWALETKYGLGLIPKHRPYESRHPYARSNYAGRPIYQLGISFFKIALLISYLRLFKGTNHTWYRRIVWITIFFVFAGHLGCALTLMFACRPVQKSWNPDIAGKCLPNGPSFTAYAIVTIVSDVIVALIPIPVLLKLKVGLGKKLGLIVIFLLGLFTTLCSVFRYMQIDRIQYGDGNSTMLIVWGVIEFNVGVSIMHKPFFFLCRAPLILTPFSQNMVSSLPFLAPIFLRKAREYTSKYSSGSGNGYPANSNVSGGRKLGKTGDSYKLGSISSGLHRKGTFVSAKGGQTSHSSGSEENILKESPDGSIVKSVTYSVHVA